MEDSDQLWVKDSITRLIYLLMTLDTIELATKIANYKNMVTRSNYFNDLPSELRGNSFIHSFRPFL